MQITYNQLIAKSLLLATKIPKGKYQFVFPIPNGGIVPGITVGRYLEVEILSWSEYQKLCKSHLDILIVDDIVDSWKTVDLYNLGQHDVAVVFKKNYAKAPAYWLEETYEWTVFPHESLKKGIDGHLINVLEFIGLPIENVNVEQILQRIKKCLTT